MVSRIVLNFPIRKLLLAVVLLSRTDYNIFSEVCTSIEPAGNVFQKVGISYFIYRYITLFIGIDRHEVELF